MNFNCSLSNARSLNSRQYDGTKVKLISSLLEKGTGQSQSCVRGFVGERANKGVILTVIYPPHNSNRDGQETRVYRNIYNDLPVPHYRTVNV